MNIQKYPQFQLYLLTLLLLNLKTQLIPENCDERCIDATIINRAYYSAYLMCELWLEDKYGFKTTKPWEFEKGEEISEHKQLRDALYDYGEIYIKSKLFQLSNLRRKADYEPFTDITPKEVTNSITYMENIINKLEFD